MIVRLSDLFSNLVQAIGGFPLYAGMAFLVGFLETLFAISLGLSLQGCVLLAKGFARILVRLFTLVLPGACSIVRVGK